MPVEASERRETDIAFQGKTNRVQQQFPSPEELYLRGALPRTTEAVDGLWLHQGDAIRAYAENYQQTPDLALELPTGSAKTIPGLLIAEWVRRKGEGPGDLCNVDQATRAPGLGDGAPRGGSESLADRQCSELGHRRRERGGRC